jgi:RNA polymerase sigma factor (sigma-70 family)
MSATAARIDAVWRTEAPRLMAALVRLTGDLGQAEDAAQDALVRALETWPSAGIPERPLAWLLRTARNTVIDRWRRSQAEHRAYEAHARHQSSLENDTDPGSAAELDDLLTSPLTDETLQLLFTACHPSLKAEYRCALVLRCVMGLTTEQIARAYLLPDSVIGQRISRAKRALRDRGIRLVSPLMTEAIDRARSVLDVVYLLFNEGYSPSSGTAWLRPELMHEAMRLARMLANLLPGLPDVHGLLALTELTAARTRARLSADGTPIALQDQVRHSWDRSLIRHGLDALETALRLCHQRGEAAGPYLLQAAITAEHMRPSSSAEVDWARISTLYDMLYITTPTPVVQLNRALARGRAVSPAAGLELLAQLDPTTLTDYAHFFGARAELLALQGRLAEARAAFERAIELSRNDGEEGLFRARLTHFAAEHEKKHGDQLGEP